MRPANTPPESPDSLSLRDVTHSDIAIFFTHQLDATANHMAAFTSKDPTDRVAHQAHWDRLLANNDILKQTIVKQTEVVLGHIASFVIEGKREVTYWLDRRYWGQGFATIALAAFLQIEITRPLYARTAQDNRASIRVLKKCGFTIYAEDRGFANARAAEIEEYILKLNAPD